MSELFVLVAVAAEKVLCEAPPSPKPKAKLKDSFVLPDAEVTAPTECRQVERSENFETIVQRHQELSELTSPVIKRPGILKKPKDWSCPSPRELSSPVKDDSKEVVNELSKQEPGENSEVSAKTEGSVEVSSESSTETSRRVSMESSRRVSMETVSRVSTVQTRKISTEVSKTDSTEHSQPDSVVTSRKISIETSQPDTVMTSKSVSIDSVGDTRKILIEIPKSELKEESQEASFPRKSSIEIQLNPVNQTLLFTDEKISSTSRYSTASETRRSTTSSTIDKSKHIAQTLVETTPVLHTSQVTLPLSNGVEPRVRVAELKMDVDRPLILTGQNTGHTVRSTSTFHLQLASCPADDPTPWRRRSIPREPSLPRESPAPIPDAKPLAPDSTSSESSSVAPTPAPAEVIPGATLAAAAPIPKVVSEATLPSSVPIAAQVAPAPATTPSVFNSAPKKTFVSQTPVKTPASSPLLHSTPLANSSRLRQQRLFEGKVAVEPVVSRIKTIPSGSSIKALAQKFQVGANEERTTTTKSSYPKAGLIFRSSSFRESPERQLTGSAGAALHRTGSQRAPSR